jgi:hypothetical protein
MQVLVRASRHLAKFLVTPQISQALSLRVFDIEGKIFLAPPWEHHPPLIR